jgi:hypothetical protein
MRDVSSLFFWCARCGWYLGGGEQLMTVLTACFSDQVGVSSLEVDSVVEYPRQHLGSL